MTKYEIVLVLDEKYFRCVSYYKNGDISDLKNEDEGPDESLTGEGERFEWTDSVYVGNYIVSILEKVFQKKYCSRSWCMKSSTDLFMK